MTVNEVKQIFCALQSVGTDFECVPLTSGHINSTFQISHSGRQYVLQKINRNIFPNPEAIVANGLAVANHLKDKDYPHAIVTPLQFADGEYLHNGEWRLFDFVENSAIYEKVNTAQQAFAAAKFLGEFHAYLQDFTVHELQETLPGFLDFESREQQFQAALKTAAGGRSLSAKDEIEFIENHRYLLDEWSALDLPKRAIHADPKISNFLFDKNDGKILALIDWDTLMPGSILYDFGDMVRSYTNLRDEDDPTVGNNFSPAHYEALKDGFLYHLKPSLSAVEIGNMELAAQIIVYIQAMRFLTDYLNGDVYYKVNRAEHNLHRTRNQINLLSEMRTKLCQAAGN